MNSIDPQWLRGALDHAKIRWRVLVISACYSGSFIPALESPDTIVITASAADRASFGCQAEADYTYFGRAFFAEAMRTQNSLTDAFKVAQASIRAREKQDDFPASNPQMRIGSNIAAVLPQLESRLFPSDSAVNLPSTLSIAPAIDSSISGVPIQTPHRNKVISDKHVVSPFPKH